ncbi:MAG: phosphotransferase [Pseudomonadota bacterium]
MTILAISENATFRADDPQRETPIVLRVHRPGYHAIAEIRAEHAWINALRAAEIVHSPALLEMTRSGTVAEFEMDGETRHLAAFAYMRGSPPSADDDLVLHIRKLGAIAARLHGHALSWVQPKGFVRKSWTFETTIGSTPHWGDWRAGLGLTAEGAALLERCCQGLQTQLAGYGMAADRLGLIDADLRLANLLVAEDEQIGVIDFDDCGFGWFMYDFAAAVSFHEHEPFISDLSAAWLEGYRSIRVLSAADEAMLPSFVMLRRMLLTAWLASHSETATARELGAGYTEGTVLLADRYLTTEA